MRVRRHPVAALPIATPAAAGTEATRISPVIVPETTAIASGYRFCGVSQSDDEMAGPGGITIGGGTALVSLTAAF